MTYVVFLDIFQSRLTEAARRVDCLSCLFENTQPIVGSNAARLLFSDRFFCLLGDGMNVKPKTYTQMTPVRLAPSQVARLDQLARECQTTRTQLVRFAIGRLLLEQDTSTPARKELAA